MKGEGTEKEACYISFGKLFIPADLLPPTLPPMPCLLPSHIRVLYNSPAISSLRVGYEWLLKPTE